MTEPTDTATWNALAGVLALMPDVHRRLLVLHVDAGCGRCRACTIAGTGSPGAPWPCPTRKLAVLAQQIHDRALRERRQP